MDSIKSFFKLRENNTSVKTEVIPGFTTFITMAYIIFVNPSILKIAGMNSANVLGDKANDFTAFNDPVVGAILVATCLSAALETLLMGLLANYPFAQAPGAALFILRFATLAKYGV